MNSFYLESLSQDIEKLCWLRKLCKFPTHMGKFIPNPVSDTMKPPHLPSSSN